MLNISLLEPPRPKPGQMLGLQLVKASARRIEMANLMATARSRWVLRFSQMPEFLDADPEAAIAFDDNGRISGLTHRAVQKIGGITSPGGPLIGRDIGDIFALSSDDLPTLTRARPPEERTIRLLNGEALFGHAMAPQEINRRAAPDQTIPAPLKALSGQDPAMARIEAARDGTLFLDEIAKMPTTVQARLARTLSDGKIRSAGSAHPVQIRAKIISAPCRDHAGAVAGPAGF